MDNFINRIFSKEPSSADKAKDRLRLVLINDRTDLSATALENLKDDLLEVLSRYIQIDPKSGGRVGGLKQLTFPQKDEDRLVKMYRATGHYPHGTDDMDPCYLPGGRIAFVSQFRQVLAYGS